MSFKNLLKSQFAYQSVLDIARGLNEFDRWAVASGFHPDDPDAAEFYRALREGH